MNQKELNNLFKHIQMTMRCPSCGHHYSRKNMHLKGCLEPIWFIEIICGFCHTPVMATIISNSFHSYSLKKKAKKENKKKVTIDDVISMHQFLKNFDGDFKKLFNE